MSEQLGGGGGGGDSNNNNDAAMEPSGRRSHKNIAGGNKTTTSSRGGGRSTHHPFIAVLGRPTYTKFPGLEDTDFGDGVPEGAVVRRACDVLREHFEKKEILKARVNFMLYQARCVYYVQ